MVTEKHKERQDENSSGGWKVGVLARRSGVSVRALHHYDAIGLLRPSGHTASGHRLYAAADVARLQQIVSLRQMGFSLDEIRACLSQSDFAPGRVLQMHIARLRERIRLQQSLCERLEGVAARLGGGQTVTTDEFLRLIEATTMIEKYYTPEQLAQLEERRKAVGEERIREVEAEWPRLMAEVQAEMDNGTAPSDPNVRELARRWMGLVEEFTGGDAGIRQSLKKMYENEDRVTGMDVGPMRAMSVYVQSALAAGEGSL